MIEVQELVRKEMLQVQKLRRLLRPRQVQAPGGQRPVHARTGARPTLGQEAAAVGGHLGQKELAPLSLGA
jgi:hypothetical protein